MCTIGTEITPRLHEKIKFHPSKEKQFFTWYLFRFVYILLLFLFFYYILLFTLTLFVFLCKNELNYFFIPPMQAETISWGNFFPTVQKMAPALSEWNLSRVITGDNLWRVFDTAAIPAKGMEFHPCQTESYNHYLSLRN